MNSFRSCTYTIRKFYLTLLSLIWIDSKVEQHKLTYEDLIVQLVSLGRLHVSGSWSSPSLSACHQGA